MRLRYITCSDPREFNDIHDIVKLAEMSPRAEIAVQMHPSKASVGMPRNQWFHELCRYCVRDAHDINLAVHVNQEWCEEICRTGEIPMELREFFGFYRKNLGAPLVKRWQLNMSNTAVHDINYSAVKKLFLHNDDHEFILQYDDRTKNATRVLYEMGAKFSLLYDASGGRGIAPSTWNKPVYDSVPMGYSGGMSPENVVKNLKQISSVVPKNREDIWIDAEGKLKTDDKFDIARAQKYITNAERWLKRQRDCPSKIIHR